MSFSLNCLESLTAISFGCYAVATGDLGTMAGGAVAGTTLLRLWSEHRNKRPLDSERALTKAREAVAKDFAVWSEREGVSAADIRAADLAMKQHLADCIPDKETLGGLVISDQSYPKSAARYVVDKLAKRDPLFRAEGVPRDFALTVVESALRSALGDADYSRELQVYMLTAIGEAVHHIRQSLVELRVELANQHAEILERVPDIALTREVSQLVGAHPEAGISELTGDVARFAREYRKLLEQLEASRSTDSELQNDLHSAREALKAGDLGLSHDRLAAAEVAARARATVAVRDLANILDLKARSALLERNWQIAAEAWSEAYHLLSTIDPAHLDLMLLIASNGLCVFGERYGVIGALSAAAQMASRGATLASIRGDAESESGHRNDLGNALLSRGTILGGAEGLASLDAAVTAYRAALQLQSEADKPVAWATTQTNLGSALSAQGRRLGGAEGIEKMQEAVDAYRAVLKVRTEAAQPAAWALTQNNLGTAFHALSEMLSGPDRLAKLDDAVMAHRAALRGCSEITRPATWAATQNNLGNALRSQAGQLCAVECSLKLTEAVAAFRAALRVYNEIDQPIAWSTVQNNLGNALGTQGLLLGGTEGVSKLNESVLAYRAASKVRTEMDLPIDWAMTQHNLAVTFAALAVFETDKAVEHLRVAELAVLDAMRINTSEHMPNDHSTAVDLLTRIRERLANLDA